MPATLREPLAVSTCIACGARSRAGECPDGCDDLPLDLVDLGAVERMQASRDARRRRVAALSQVANALAEDARGLEELREAAQEALRVLVPPPPEVEIVEAWGCPTCGRIEAPQPCLGVCVRRPVVMVDAQRYRELEDEALEDEDRRLTAVARLAAAVRPQAGKEAQTRAALQVRARAALQASSA